MEIELVVEQIQKYLPINYIWSKRAINKVWFQCSIRSIIAWFKDNNRGISLQLNVKTENPLVFKLSEMHQLGKNCNDILPLDKRILVFNNAAMYLGLVKTNLRKQWSKPKINKVSFYTIDGLDMWGPAVELMCDSYIPKNGYPLATGGIISRFDNNIEDIITTFNELELGDDRYIKYKKTYIYCQNFRVDMDYFMSRYFFRTINDKEHLETHCWADSYLLHDLCVHYDTSYLYDDVAYPSIPKRKRRKLI